MMTQPVVLSHEEFARRSFIRDKKIIGGEYNEFTWKTIPKDLKDTYLEEANEYINNLDISQWPTDLWDSEYHNE